MNDPQDLPILELLRRCLGTQDQALWAEFVHRTQPVIGGVVAKTVRRWMTPQPVLVDDLVQDTYIKLFAGNSKALREFECEHEAALFGFLKTVASNVVHDHFRSSYSQKRGSGHDEEDLEKVGSTLGGSAGSNDRHILFNEILKCLRGLAGEPNFPRDWAIFQLYYFDGLTAKAISQLPGIDLTVKGVESTLLRLVRYIKEKLNPGRAG
jgi:RNA polymerase sigma-70 factor (ECF subfamily)